MPELKTLICGENTDLESDVVYTRFENFVIYSIAEPLRIGSAMDLCQDIMVRIDSEEWVYLFGKPHLVFYQLETNRTFPDYEPGQFDFARLFCSATPDQAKWATWIMFCPPKVSELFRPYIGGEKLVQMGPRHSTYNQFDKNRETPPQEQILWLSETLRGLGLAARKDQENNMILIGVISPRPPRWKSIMWCSADTLPSPDDLSAIGQLKYQVEAGLREFEQRESEHRQFLRCVMYGEDDD